MVRWFFAAGLVCICSVTAFAEEDAESANYLIDACRIAADSATVSTVDTAFKAGLCVGELYVVKSITACIPRQVTTAQLAKVVIAYLDKHPARLHEKFLLLATEAVIDAWHCEPINSN